MQKAAAPCEQPPFPSPLTVALPAVFAELCLPPQLGTHQPSSPLWVLLAGAQLGRQTRAPQQKRARDCSASAARPGLTIFISWVCLFFFFPGEMFVILIKKKTPTKSQL